MVRVEDAGGLVGDPKDPPKVIEQVGRQEGPPGRGVCSGARGRSP